MAEPRVARTVVNPNGVTPELERAFQGASAAMRPAPVDLSGLNRAIRRAERQTDENYHTEALKTMTDFFHYEDLSDELAEIAREHGNAGSLGPDLFDRRNRAMDELFDRVRRDYGQSVLNRVYRGL